MYHVLLNKKMFKCFHFTCTSIYCSKSRTFKFNVRLQFHPADSERFVYKTIKYVGDVNISVFKGNINHDIAMDERPLSHRTKQPSVNMAI